MSNPRWDATTTTGAPLSRGMLDRLVETIMSGKHEMPRRYLSPARYRKCVSGDHEFMNDICIHCWRVK